MTFHSSAVDIGHVYHLGESLKAAQKEASLSNGDVAKALGVGVVQVSRWRGWQDMRFSRLMSLCALFNMTVEEFVELGIAPPAGRV